VELHFQNSVTFVPFLVTTKLAPSPSPFVLVPLFSHPNAPAPDPNFFLAQIFPPFSPTFFQSIHNIPPPTFPHTSPSPSIFSYGQAPLRTFSVSTSFPTPFALSRDCLLFPIQQTSNCGHLFGGLDALPFFPPRHL